MTRERPLKSVSTRKELWLSVVVPPNQLFYALPFSPATCTGPFPCLLFSNGMPNDWEGCLQRLQNGLGTLQPRPYLQGVLANLWISWLTIFYREGFFTTVFDFFNPISTNIHKMLGYLIEILTCKVFFWDPDSKS